MLHVFFAILLLTHRPESILVKLSYSRNLVLFFLGSMVLVVLNCNAYAWLLSSVVAIFLALCLNNIVKPIKFIYPIFVYMGVLSAFIFCVHPHFRHLYMYNIGEAEAGFADIFLYYFIPSILFAFLYKKVHQELFINK